MASLTAFADSNLVVPYEWPAANMEVNRILNRQAEVLNHLITQYNLLYDQVQAMNATLTDIADELAALDYIEWGSVTITDPATTANVTLGTTQPNTNYRVQLTKFFGGAAPATDVYYNNKTTSGFTINVNPAMGLGTQVQVNWLVIR